MSRKHRKEDKSPKGNKMAAKFEAIVTPLGELQWLFITGMGKENYNRDGYEYTSDILLEGDEAETLKTKITEYFHAEFGAKANPKSLGFKDEDDGRTRFSFKTKTTKKDNSARKIIVGDSKGKKMDLGDRKISNGSTGVIHGALGTYVNGQSKGVSLYLNKVQLLDFIPYEGEGEMGELGGAGGYEEPDMAEMEIQDGGKAIVKQRFPVSQYGKVLTLPVE